MVYDFLMGALPWVLLGLAIAIIAVARNAAKKNGKKGSMGVAWFVAAAMNYAVALLMMADKGHMNSDFVTWFCLGSLFMSLGSIEYYKEKKAEKNKDVVR